MIDAAVTETAGAVSSTRLVLLPSGVIQTIGADKGGHMQAQISAGTVHELTLAERKHYLAGGTVSWETINHD